jgi:hypothetical protein
MSKDDNSLSIIFVVVKEALETQQAQKSSLETKASTLIAFAGGIFALLMGARETLLLFQRDSQILIIVSIILFSASVIFSNIVSWVRAYRVDPAPDTLAKKFLESPVQDTQLQLISNWISSWKSNRIMIERSALFLRLAYLTQAIAFILLGASLLLTIL